jgi:hypothetical protein
MKILTARQQCQQKSTQMHFSPFLAKCSSTSPNRANISIENVSSGILTNVISRVFSSSLPSTTGDFPMQVSDDISRRFKIAFANELGFKAPQKTNGSPVS